MEVLGGVKLLLTGRVILTQLKRTRDEAPPGLTALFIPLSWIWRRVPKDRDIWYTKEMEGNV